MAIHDWADLVEHPLHLLGLHSASWVIVAACLGVIVVASGTIALRRLRR
jgi:hypothetical protein